MREPSTQDIRVTFLDGPILTPFGLSKLKTWTMKEYLGSLLRFACKRTKPFGGSAVLGACLIGRGDLEQQSLIERSS